MDVAAHKGVLLYHRVENISMGGICIQTATIQEVGSLVDVDITFPELEGEMVSIRGQVVWANRTPPQDVGIRWVNLDDRKRDLLRRYIEAVDKRELSPELISIDESS